MDRTSHVIIVGVALYITILLSCKLKDSSEGQNIFEKASKTDSLSYYFPSILSDTSKISDLEYKDYEQRWYSSTLYSFKEPILYNKTDTQTLYRLLWLRSFHRPVCFSMKQSKTSFFLKTQTLDRHPEFITTVAFKGRDERTGKKLYDTSRADRFALINFSKTITLTSEQWIGIENRLSKIDFWNSPVLEPDSIRDNDGSEWTLEGRKNGKYHFINRYNPDKDLMDLGRYLIKLGGLEIKEDAFY